MCFLIDESGETSGDMEEHLVSHGHVGNSSGAGFICQGRQCLDDFRVTFGTGALLSPAPTMPGIYECQGEGWLLEKKIFFFKSPSTYFSDFTKKTQELSSPSSLVGQCSLSQGSWLSLNTKIWIAPFLGICVLKKKILCSCFISVILTNILTKSNKGRVIMPSYIPSFWRSQGRTQTNSHIISTLMS